MEDHSKVLVRKGGTRTPMGVTPPDPKSVSEWEENLCPDQPSSLPGLFRITSAGDLYPGLDFTGL